MDHFAFFLTAAKAEQPGAQILSLRAPASIEGVCAQTIAQILELRVMEGGMVAAPAEHIAGVEVHFRRLVQVRVSSLSQGRS